MKNRLNTLAVGTALLAAGLAGASTARFAHAQSSGAAASRAGTRTVPDVLARIGQSANVTVVADATLASERVPLPTTAATPETVEAQIAQIVKALPDGTTWSKLYLPAPTGRAWSGDDVAAYVSAQKRLFGQSGAAPTGTVEILGQRIPQDKAAAYVSDLNLKPVYLVTNPSRQVAASSNQGTTADVAKWAQMTPEQQQQYARQQAQQLMNMDPALRRQMFEQERALRRAVFEQMTPEQRQQLFPDRDGRRGGPGGPDRPGSRGGRP